MSRSKVVPIDGVNYQVSKLPPEEGGFILMRMVGVSMRTANDDAPKKPTKKEKEPNVDEKKAVVDGETHVRALSFMVFSGAIAFADFKFIQSACMRCIARIENRSGVEFPMPVMSDAGEWTDETLVNNIGLVMKLMTEVLVFCFADFFDGGGKLA